MVSSIRAGMMLKGMPRSLKYSWRRKDPDAKIMGSISVQYSAIQAGLVNFLLTPGAPGAFYWINFYQKKRRLTPLRKVSACTRSRLTFVDDDAIFKTLYLAIRNASKKWTMPIKQWGMELNQFTILFGNEWVPLL
jgi:hypothetical protein